MPRRCSDQFLYSIELYVDEWIGRRKNLYGAKLLNENLMG